jgi:hypothetical protein
MEQHPEKAGKTGSERTGRSYYHPASTQRLTLVAPITFTPAGVELACTRGQAAPFLLGHVPRLGASPMPRREPAASTRNCHKSLTTLEPYRNHVPNLRQTPGSPAHHGQGAVASAMKKTVGCAVGSFCIFIARRKGLAIGGRPDQEDSSVCCQGVARG